MRRMDRMQTSSVPARRPPVGLPPMNTVLGKPDFTQKYNVLPDLSAARRRFEADDDGVDFDPGFHVMHDRKQGDYPPLILRHESGLSPQRSFHGLPGPPKAMSFRSDDAGLYGQHSNGPFRNELAGFDEVRSNMVYRSDIDEVYRANGPSPLRNDVPGLHGVQSDTRYENGLSGLHGVHSDLPLRSNTGGLYGAHSGMHSMSEIPELRGTQSDMPFRGSPPASHKLQNAAPKRNKGSKKKKKEKVDGNGNIGRRLNDLKLCSDRLSVPTIGRDLSLYGKPSVLPGIEAGSPIGSRNLNDELHTATNENRIQVGKVSERSTLNHNKGFGSNTNVIPAIKPSVQTEHSPAYISSPRYKTLDDGTGVFPMTCIDRSVLTSNAQGLSLFGKSRSDVLPGITPKNGEENNGGFIKKAQSTYALNAKYLSGENDDSQESLSEKMEEDGKRLGNNHRRNIDGLDDCQDMSHMEYESSDQDSVSKTHSESVSERKDAQAEADSNLALSLRPNIDGLDDFQDISHVEYESSDKESRSESNKQGTIKGLKKTIEGRSTMKIETGRSAEFNVRSNTNDLDDFHDISHMECESSDQELTYGSHNQGTIGEANKADEEKSDDKVDVGGNLDLNLRPNINGLNELKDVSQMDYESSVQESLSGSNKQGTIGGKTQPVEEKSESKVDSAEKLEHEQRPSIAGIDDLKDISHMEYESSDQESISGSNKQGANQGLSRVFEEKAEHQIHVEAGRSSDLNMSPIIDGRDDPQNACDIDYESSDHDLIFEPNKQGAIEGLYKAVEDISDNTLDKTGSVKDCDSDRHIDRRDAITSDIETDIGTKESCGDTIEDEWVSRSELSKTNVSKGSHTDSPATAIVEGRITSDGFNANEVKFEFPQKMYESSNHEYLLKNSCSVDMDIPKKEMDRKESKETKEFFVATTQNDNVFNYDNHENINTRDKMYPKSKMTGTESTMTLENGQDTQITRKTNVQKAISYENDATNHVLQTRDDSQSQEKTPTTKSSVTKANVILVNPEMVKRQQRKKRIARENAKLLNDAKISASRVGYDQMEADKYPNLNRKVSFSNDPEVHIVKPVAVLKKEMKKTWKDNSSEEYTYDTDEDLDNISDDIFDHDANDDGDAKMATFVKTRNNTEIENKASDITKPENGEDYEKKGSLEDSLIQNHKKASEKTAKRSNDQITNDLVTKNDPSSLQPTSQPSTKNEEQNSHKKKGELCIHVPIKYVDFDISVKRAKNKRAGNDKADDNLKPSIPAGSNDEKSVKVVPDEAQAKVKCKDLPIEKRKTVQHELTVRSEKNDDRLKYLTKLAISPEVEGETKRHSNSLDMDIAYMNAIFKELDAPARRRVIAEILKLTQNPTSIATDPSMCRLVNRRYDVSRTDQRGPTRMVHRQGLAFAADDEESSSATDTIPEKLVYNKCQRISNEDICLNGTRGNKWPKRRIGNEAKKSFGSFPVAGSSRTDNNTARNGEIRDKLYTRLSDHTFSSSSFVSIARGKRDPYDGTKYRRNVRRQPLPAQVNHGVEESKQSKACENTPNGNDDVKAKDQRETDGSKKTSGGIKAFFRKLICVCKPKNDAEDE